MGGPLFEFAETRHDFGELGVVNPLLQPVVKPLQLALPFFKVFLVAAGGFLPFLELQNSGQQRLNPRIGHLLGRGALNLRDAGFKPCKLRPRTFGEARFKFRNLFQRFAGALVGRQGCRRVFDRLQAFADLKKTGILVSFALRSLHRAHPDHQVIDPRIRALLLALGPRLEFLQLLPQIIQRGALARPLVVTLKSRQAPGDFIQQRVGDALSGLLLQFGDADQGRADSRIGRQRPDLTLHRLNACLKLLDKFLVDGVRF